MKTAQMHPTSPRGSMSNVSGVLLPLQHQRAHWIPLTTSRTIFLCPYRSYPITDWHLHLTFTWPLIQTDLQRMQQQNAIPPRIHKTNTEDYKSWWKYANKATAEFECCSMPAALFYTNSRTNCLVQSWILSRCCEMGHLYIDNFCLRCLYLKTQWYRLPAAVWAGLRSADYVTVLFVSA